MYEIACESRNIQFQYFQEDDLVYKILVKCMDKCFAIWKKELILIFKSHYIDYEERTFLMITFKQQIRKNNRMHQRIINLYKSSVNISLIT